MGHDAGPNNLGTIKEVKKKRKHFLHPSSKSDPHPECSRILPKETTVCLTAAVKYTGHCLGLFAVSDRLCSVCPASVFSVEPGHKPCTQSGMSVF